MGISEIIDSGPEAEDEVVTRERIRKWLAGGWPKHPYDCYFCGRKTPGPVMLFVWPHGYPGPGEIRFSHKKCWRENGDGLV